MAATSGSKPRREPIVAAIVVLGLILVFGGASRADALTQSIVRLVAIFGIGWTLIRPNWRDGGAMRAPIVLMLAWLTMIALQLLPLPAEMWFSLPGREQFREAFAAAGVADAWRPLTLSPDWTRNAFFAAFVPLAVLLVMARLRTERLRIVAIALLVFAAASALAGIVQISGQMAWTYPYRITNEGSAVGLFANRNHQALLLALTFPLLALFAAWPADHVATGPKTRNFVALAGAVLIVPLVLVTGSRAGLILMVIGFAGAWFVWQTAAGSRTRSAAAQKRAKRSPRAKLLIVALVGGLIGLMGLTLVFARAEAIRRLFSEDVSQEIRVRLFSTMLDIGNTFAPFGAGFGTFDPVFRMFEPFDNLSPVYVNRAHNDLLEIYIEGGAVSLVILAIFLVWLARKALLAWRPAPAGQVKEWLLARCGIVVLLLQLVASLADYPLRTPAQAAIAAVAVAMVCRIGRLTAPSS